MFQFSLSFYTKDIRTNFCSVLPENLLERLIYTKHLVCVMYNIEILFYHNNCCYGCMLSKHQVHLNQIKTKEKICVETRDGNDEFCTKACAKNFDLIKAVGRASS